MKKGMLLDDDNDLMIFNGSMRIGERTMQDVYMVLSINQGDLKEDPLAGVNLTRMIRSHDSKEKMRKTIEIGLKRVNINWDEVKDQIQVFANKK